MTDIDPPSDAPVRNGEAASGAGELRETAAHAGDAHVATRATASVAGVDIRVKPGVRGFPEAPPGARELAPFVSRAVGAVRTGSGRVLDASGSAGAMAAIAAHAAPASARARVLEPSAAARTCAEERFDGTGVHVDAGWVWDAAGANADVVALLPPADRGSARVHAEFAGAAAALSPDGTALIALHKDRGGKRYLADALRWFGSVETVGKSKGWRIGAARDPVRREGTAGPSHAEPPWKEFEVAGRRFEALPGVFAAGKLDPGTEVLLEALEADPDAADVRGSRVLDLGCGYGVLALWAAERGADATAVDDDLLAVRSAERNAARHDLELRTVHSDLDTSLGEDDRFDRILCNPPFHVGKEVRLDLSEAFVRAAHRRLDRGGRLWLVANRALPYERYLDGWSAVDTLAATGGFKVLRATR